MSRWFKSHKIGCAILFISCLFLVLALCVVASGEDKKEAPGFHHPFPTPRLIPTKADDWVSPQVSSDLARNLKVVISSESVRKPPILKGKKLVSCSVLFENKTKYSLTFYPRNFLVYDTGGIPYQFNILSSGVPISSERDDAHEKGENHQEMSQPSKKPGDKNIVIQSAPKYYLNQGQNPKPDPGKSSAPQRDGTLESDRFISQFTVPAGGIVQVNLLCTFPENRAPSRIVVKYGNYVAAKKNL